MIYKNACGLKLSQLGFGTMRLPVKEDKSIDEARVQTMVDLAMEAGVNYFDTAYPYHGGYSEIVIGKALKKYPRDSYYLATKYPGHQISSSYDPAAVFEEQLKKCDVDYFDFYLLHNVYENDIDVYKDPKWGIIDYFKEQVKNDRIKHLGFSTHARPDTLEAFLEYAGESMEFCQIQLNYLDWTLQDGKAKVDILNKWNIPIWIMEPLRGGRLVNLSDKEKAALEEANASMSPAEWGLRFLQEVPGVAVILSGMSSEDQMKDNLKTFEAPRPLSEKEHQALLDLAEGMKDALPCTRCRYCCDGCPMGLDIPMLIHAYNDVKFSGGSNTVKMQFDALPEDKLPSACIGCGACAAICPQNINIPEALKELSDTLAKLPSWAELCRQREEAARKLKEQTAK
ncbi:MAG: aldo/keto reductase [Firmicutes bacterium]|nr:aldo/keto reductase [Bacillota bacterium]